jgi:hypothetical protein
MLNKVTGVMLFHDPVHVMHSATNWMGAPCALQIAVVKYKDGHSALASLVRLENVQGGITYMILSL